jgi:hypothetical protein
MCAYCLLQEGAPITGGFQSFQIDHFRPVAKFPHLTVEYWNLYYCCHWCNNTKSDTWPNRDQARQGYRFVDPCVEDFYPKHARIDASSGRLDPQTRPGDFTVREIFLNRKVFRALILRHIEAQTSIERVRLRLRQLSAEKQPATELIAALEEQLKTLASLINPKVPYEPEDLLS